MSETYKYLGRGEVLRAGDEWFCGNRWIPVHPTEFGLALGPNSLPFKPEYCRRPVETAPATQSAPTQFWLVWRGDNLGRLPVVRHDSELKARNEAERLAEKHPGAPFYVLEAKSVSQTPTRVTTTQLKSNFPAPTIY